MYVKSIVGLVVTSPVMEVEVTRSIPAIHSSTNSAWKSCKLNFHYTSLARHNILSMTKLKSKQQKQPPHNNRPKRLLLKASSYLSIGHLPV